ncbi:MAG: hypothetical protein AAFV54_12300 [Pseudomonadota bacterium]
MFRDAWAMRTEQAVEAGRAIKGSIKKIDSQIEQLLDRIVEAANPSVVSAYEKRIAKLERDKALATEKLNSTANPVHTREESFEHAMAFLANPWKIWTSGGLEIKKTVLRLAFSERLAHSEMRDFEHQK